jgi:hypothetical protein
MNEPRPSRLFAAGRLVLAATVDPERRREVEGDLIELWHRRRAAGRRDLRRAYLRDLAGLVLSPPRRTRRRMRTVIAVAFLRGGFAMWRTSSTPCG